MGTFARPIIVYSPSGEQPVTLDALVDSGATYSMIPGPVLESLRIQPVREMHFLLADERVIRKHIAEVAVEVEGRRTTTWCIFGDAGSTALLGAYILEGLQLAIDPYGKRLVPLTGYLMPLLRDDGTL